MGGGWVVGGWVDEWDGLEPPPTPLPLTPSPITTSPQNSPQSSEVDTEPMPAATAEVLLRLTEHCRARFSHALTDAYGVDCAVLYCLLTLPSQERDANWNANQRERQANLELVQRSAEAAAELSKKERDANMLKNALARTQLEERLNAALANLAPAAGGDGLPLSLTLPLALTLALTLTLTR